MHLNPWIGYWLPGVADGMFIALVLVVAANWNRNKPRGRKP